VLVVVAPPALAAGFAPVGVCLLAVVLAFVLARPPGPGSDPTRSQGPQSAFVSVRLLLHMAPEHMEPDCQGLE